jgi:hypothetical protein
MNAVVLPFALAVNRPAIVAPYARLSEVLGSDAVYVLARRIGAPKRLAEIGVPPMVLIWPCRSLLLLPQGEIGADLEKLLSFVRAVESLGFNFLHATGYVLGADPSTRPGWDGAYDVHDLFHEPFVFYGYLAALNKFELATVVLILPQRQTALVAKQAADVDILTNGRFRLGVGVGWNQVEYEALGIDFQTRARFAKSRSRCFVGFGMRSQLTSRFDSPA